MENRSTYFEIKENFLECCFDYCRSKIDSEWLEKETEIGFAYEQYVYMEEDKYTAYKITLENLMLETITLILRAGRSSVAEEYHRMMISRLLSKGDISQEINNLPEEERFDFVSDLEVLGIEIAGVLSVG